MQLLQDFSIRNIYLSETFIYQKQERSKMQLLQYFSENTQRHHRKQHTRHMMPLRPSVEVNVMPSDECVASDVVITLTHHIYSPQSSRLLRLKENIVDV